MRAALRRQFQRAQPVAIDRLLTLGVSRTTLFRELKRLQDAGEIVRVRRGTYLPGDQFDAADGWALAMRQHPQGVLCLLSALLFHQFTTQAPPFVWLALPRGARAPGAGAGIKAVYLSPDAYREGIQRHARPEGEIRVYSPAKTVADCFKFRHRIGLDVALEALREGWRERRFTLDELNRMARVCRVQAVIRPYVEALVA